MREVFDQEAKERAAKGRSLGGKTAGRSRAKNDRSVETVPPSNNGNQSLEKKSQSCGDKAKSRDRAAQAVGGVSLSVSETAFRYRLP